MGHYYCDMFPNGRDETFYSRYAKYKQDRRGEIDDIISENPIKYKEIKIGDKLTLYAPLKGLSKIRFDDKGEFHKIREAFELSSQIYGISMNLLSSCNRFTVYDKRKMKINPENTKWYEIRIDEPSKKFLDWLPYWVDIEYFEKI
jgi:hypothetical protein